MNATQGKALLAVTNEALSLLERSGHPLAPRYVVELRERLSAAIAPAERRITGRVNLSKAWMALASAEMAAWRATGESVEAFAHRVVERFRAGQMSENIVRVKSFDAETYARKMARCACGHMAIRHERDELDNLLICLDCDTCDHFHYEVNAQQDEAA